MKLVMLINSASTDEKNIANQFKNLLKAENHMPPIRILSPDASSVAAPDIVIEICDHNCSAFRCSEKFKSLLRWRATSIKLLRPLLCPVGENVNHSFLISDLRGTDDGPNGAVEWFSRLRRSSFLACSPAWPVLASNPFYRVAQVQKAICESDELAFDLVVLAQSVDRSPCWLSSMFHRYSNIHLRQFLIKQKLCRALWLLISSNMPIKEIGYSVNYHDPLYFSKEFKRRLGIPPLEVRRVCR